ncbi:hypothetical protein SEHO0A_00649 [Salmonella enterica subsp. houtenae str. ATCC BAA-1581]|nr:hypothetical protein SEHO0A_00649 [Salmonella enterica subsp. houtenae str. ATCC BAA-1581]
MGLLLITTCLQNRQPPHWRFLSVSNPEISGSNTAAAVLGIAGIMLIR